MDKLLYDRKISFIDANNERVNLKIQIRNQNDAQRYPYGELSICSQSGQGQFVPDTDEQKALLEIWDTYHLNGMSSGTDKQNAILKKANAPQEYTVRQDELRNYDFNGNFMLDMNKRILATGLEQRYLELNQLVGIVSTLIEKNSYSCVKMYYDILINIVEEDGIKFKYTDPNTRKLKTCILFKDGYKEGVLSFDFPKNPKSKETKQAILSAIQKRIDNYPTDNLSAIFDIDRGKLMRYGCTWVIKDLPEDLPKTLDTLCDEIEEDMKSKTMVSDLTYEQFAAQYPDFNNPQKVYALACNRGGYLDSLEDVSEDRGNSFYFEGDDWLVCTDEEADQEHLESIESYLSDCGFDGFNQNSVKTSIELDTDGDVVISKSVCIPQNERGNSLNRYDGYEHDINVNGTTYYIYQQ